MALSYQFSTLSTQEPQLASEDSRRSFNLSTGPLYRASLLRLGNEDYILLLNFHHIVFDAWSAGVLVREFTALYNAFNNGQPSPLPKLPIQYTDFAQWQQQQLQGQFDGETDLLLEKKAGR
ncbi:MAG: condensation domain-containing protein [Gloeotrichia echinulata DEX184]|nr:hypothetical protein [Gloeotrichia echinulata DEX184]